jgi:hypothetical protein
MNFPFKPLLRSGFNFYGTKLLKAWEPVFPGERQDKVGSYRIHERIAPEPCRGKGNGLNRNGCDDAAHRDS